ncbi:MAG: NAD(P)/FAD-dependent oxidoreductase [Actinomycetota bacterium]|nr:NAD(P)/FAD-dependent oxidoreductase [Actinomycetota bacterium]
MRYPHLFSSGKIGNVTIKNRMVMAPMGTGMANYDGTPSEQIISYYEERAKNGLGLLITEITSVNIIHGVSIPRQLSMAFDRHVAPFSAMVERIHSHGTKVFCQLHHPGRQGLSMMGIYAPQVELMGRLWPGVYRKLPPLFKAMGKFPAASDMMMKYMRWPAVVGPSKIPSRLFNQRTRALMRWEIRSLVRDFVRAARRVQSAGGDGVELHGTHGYLIQQFLSTQSNRRRDEYGGSLDNRMRFLLDIISGIQRECGGDFPIAVRLTVDEFYRRIGKSGQGIELEEGVEIARRLERSGIDAIDVSSGTYDTMNWWLEPMSFEDGWRKYLARAVKEAVSIPVIAANLIRSPRQAEDQIAEGIQDFVSLGRPLLADPAWVAKAMEGREDEITRCISCLRCIESLMEKAVIGLPLECAVNPRLGREREREQPRADGEECTVAVIGTGPAGLSAAGVLASRGFNTVVLERDESAGGQLKLAVVPPRKDKIDWCIQDLEGAARRSGAEIRFDTEATVPALEALDPHAVIAATGSQPIVPDIPGVNRVNVCTVNAILEETVKLEGKTVAVIGSGLTGLETAEKLAEDGNRLLIVEMLDEIGPDAYHQNLMDITGRLDESHAEFITSHELVEIEDGVITLRHVKSGGRTTRQVDFVVLAMGVRSDDRLVRELWTRFPRVYAIGDARVVGRIHDAVRDGFDTAWNL